MSKIYNPQTFDKIREAATFASSYSGIVECNISGCVDYDCNGQVTIPANMILNFGVDGYIDFKGQPSALIVNSYPKTYSRFQHIFANTKALDQDVNTEGTETVGGDWGRGNLQTAWFGITMEYKRDSANNWNRLQSAIDAALGTTDIELPAWSNKNGDQGGYIQYPIRLDRGYKRLIGAGGTTKLHFYNVQYTNGNLKGAINLATPTTLALSRYQTGMQGFEVIYQDDIAKSVIHANSTLEEGTFIRDIVLDNYPQYGIHLSGGVNGLEISNMHIAGRGFATGVSERGGILKDGPQSNPEGAVSIERVTYNNGGTGVVDSIPKYGFINRHWGRVRLCEFHNENSDIGYLFDEQEDGGGQGNYAYIIMDNCDHRASASQKSIYINNGSSGIARINLHVRNLHLLGGTTHIAVEDVQHSVLFSTIGSVNAYLRSRYRYDGPYGT